MKKKWIAALAGILAVAMLSGCGKGLSNDYVTVKQYKGLEVAQVTPAEITDEQVEQTIQNALSASATNQDVTDRASQNGDWVNIDFTGYIDDEAFENGASKGYDLQLGSGTLLKATEDYRGFEEQLEGHKAGDEFDIMVQFPSSYPSDPTKENLPARFHIVMNKVYQKVNPELTDKWASEYTGGECSTVEEYRTSLKEKMVKGSQDSADAELRSSVQQALYDQLDIKKYPEDAVQSQINQVKEYYSSMAGLYGMELTDFVEAYLQTTEEDFNNNVKTAAEQSAAVDEALKLIAEKEKLTPTDEEYDKAIAEFAKEAGVEEVDTYKEQYGEEVLRLAVLRDVVTEFLIEHCVQVEES